METVCPWLALIVGEQVRISCVHVSMVLVRAAEARVFSRQACQLWLQLRPWHGLNLRSVVRRELEPVDQSVQAGGLLLGL